MDFPRPQTLGRTRSINTVPADPNVGLMARPTAYESQSFFDQILAYVNNYGGSVPLSQTIKGIESQQKAAPIGNVTPSRFDTISRTLESARDIKSTWKTIADKIIKDRGIVIQSDYPGSDVPGPIPAPRVENYSGADTRDKAWSDVKRFGEDLVGQVKGLFNLAYDGPQKQTGTPNIKGRMYSIRAMDPKAMAAALLLGVFLMG